MRSENMALELNNCIMQALSAVQNLRAGVTSSMQHLSNGTDDRGTESGESVHKQFVLDLESDLININKQYQTVEKHCTVVAQVPPPSQGPNSHLMALDPVIDKTPLYNQLINSYKWSTKTGEFATHGSSLLNSNSLRRTAPHNALVNKRLRKPPSNSHNVPVHLKDHIRVGLQVVFVYNSSCVRDRTSVSRVKRTLRHLLENCLLRLIEQLIQTWTKSFSDMSISISRPLGNPTILKVTILNVLHATIILRGLLIENVIVRGYGEVSNTDSPKEEVWTKSRYQVFEKVTDHANAAMQHFFSPLKAELSIKSFLTWLHSYRTLFSAPCKKCQKFLLDNLPPTWRDNRTLDAYHETCRL